jgi:hypothetical protein
MTALAIIAGTQALLVAFLVWDRRRASPDVLALIALVDRLAQRIQSPQAAVLEHFEQHRALRGDEYAPSAIPPDDDDAYWASKDKLAEQLMAQETQTSDVGD